MTKIELKSFLWSSDRFITEDRNVAFKRKSKITLIQQSDDMNAFDIRRSCWRTLNMKTIVCLSPKDSLRTEDKNGIFKR